MQKLAREAIIFVVAIPLLLAISVFVYLHFIMPATAPPAPAPPSELALLAGLLWGLPLGIALWILYRAIRFMIKG
jgi:hypothetical protein